MKILVIGGAGFIGSNIINYYLNQTDHIIHAVDNLERGSFKHIPDEQAKRVKFLKADLTLASEFECLDNDYDFVFMLAALVGVDKVNSIPHEVLRINTLLTLNTAEWLKRAKCKKVVFTSTSENYAGTIEEFGYAIPTPESVPLTISDISHPRFTYAVTKMLGESFFINYAKMGFFESSIVRYHNVYGPNMGFRHVIPHLAERFLKKESPFLIYGHDQTRSFNYIDDAVKGTIKAAELGQNTEIYHIGSEDEITIETLVRHVGNHFNFDGEFKNAPTFPGSVSRRCPEISKAKKDLNYFPEVDWKVGVDKTIRWYKDYLNDKSNQTESFYDKYGIKK